MSKNSLFDFHFPDGFPADITKGALSSDADDLHMAAFDYFDRLDEALQHDTYQLPASLNDNYREVIESLQDIINEHVRAVYKFRMMQDVHEQISDLITVDQVWVKADQPMHLAMAHVTAMSSLRMDAIMQYNSLIKSLEFMVFNGYNMKDQACRIFDDLEKADATWRRQARNELGDILKMTEPGYSRLSKAASAAQG